MGIVISVFGVSVCIGPVLGGALIDRLSWRWIFWMYEALLLYSYKALLTDS